MTRFRTAALIFEYLLTAICILYFHYGILFVSLEVSSLAFRSATNWRERSLRARDIRVPNPEAGTWDALKLAFTARPKEE